jgi:hypothetical protein
MLPQIGLDFLTSNLNLSLDFNSSRIDEKIVQESFLFAEIFYNSLAYTVSFETPQLGIVDLLANVGGNLSLFLGVSVFSLWELIEFFIEVYYLKTEKTVTKINAAMDHVRVDT